MVRWPVKTLPGCEDLPPTDAHRSHRGSWRRCDRWSEEFRSVHSCFTANHWSHWDRWHLNLTAVVQGDFFWQCKGHMVPGWWKIPTICQLLVLYREGLIAWRGVFFCSICLIYLVKHPANNNNNKKYSLWFIFILHHHSIGNSSQ